MFFRKVVVHSCPMTEHAKTYFGLPQLTTPPPPPSTSHCRTRYLYKADPSAGNEGDKAWAELWAFSAAILPRIHECDVEVAAVIRDNADLASSDAPVSEGYVAMKEKLETVYSCLGISCGQVGGLLMDEGTEYFNDFGPCDDGDGDGVAGWVVAVIVIAVIAVVGAAALLCYKKRTSQKKTAQAMESDLGGFGAKPAGTI